MFPQLPGFEIFHRIKQKPGVVIGSIGIFTGRVDVHTEPDVDTGLPETMRLPPGTTEQIDGIDFPLSRFSGFRL
jgi:hypothetical protein